MPRPVPLLRYVVRWLHGCCHLCGRGRITSIVLTTVARAAVLWITTQPPCPSTAAAAVVRVPADVATIQAGIDSVSPGDTVLVAPGRYLEHLRIGFKNIVLRGEGGAETTIVDGSVAPGNTIVVLGVNRSTVIEDLTVTGASFEPDGEIGTAISVHESSPTIQRCRLVGNRGPIGAGVAAIFFSYPLIRDCWIAHNVGAAIYVERGYGLRDAPLAEIENTFMVHNVGHGVWAVKAARVSIRSCTIAFNAADGIRGELRGGGTTKTFIRVENSIITHNEASGIGRYESRVCFSLRCNDVFGNMDANWLGTNPADGCFPGRGGGSVSIDPEYRDPDNDDFLLVATSPLFTLCRPGSCGALGAGNICSVVVERKSWTTLKSTYRE